MATNIKTVSTSDYNAVIEALRPYVEGLRAGRSTKVQEAFLKDATMYGFTKGELVVHGPISNLYDFVDSGGEAPNLIAHLDVLAITPTIAVVRVDMENDAVGGNYTDFHTLLKQNGKWNVISKVYHQYED
jgi:hypothetical protein